MRKEERSRGMVPLYRHIYQLTLPTEIRKQGYHIIHIIWVLLCKKCTVAFYRVLSYSSLKFA